MPEAPADRRLHPRPSLSEDVYGVILDMLMSHDMEPGQQFNIDAFAREIGVSPTPVREALTRAESEGLVVHQPLRGYTVAPLLNSRQANQMTEVRILLEPRAAAIVAETATPEIIERLYSLVQLPAYSDLSLAYRDDMQHDATFHEAIWELAGNPFIHDCLARLHAHLHMYRLHYTSELRELSQIEHTAIVDGIASGDPEKARTAMHSHIDTAIGRVEHLASTPEDA